MSKRQAVQRVMWGECWDEISFSLLLHSTWFSILSNNPEMIVLWINTKCSLSSRRRDVHRLSCCCAGSACRKRMAGKRRAEGEISLPSVGRGSKEVK